MGVQAGMKYRLTHRTLYHYAHHVGIGLHFMHLLPRARPGQLVHAATLVILPKPADRVDEQDHFGNRTSLIAQMSAHKSLDVVLHAEIEVSLPRAPEPAASMAWEETSKAAFRAPEAAEFRYPSALASPDEAIALYAAQHFPPGQPIMAGLLSLMAGIHADMAYRPGVTAVSTTAIEALKTRAGVCQDYAHLMIACLRALDLPARYVSGYLRTYPPPGETARRGADQSHAWIGAWLGPHDGWVDFDPTNNLVVHDEHVTLAWGRDFGDVSPLRGVILGGGRHSLTVEVDLQPINEEESRDAAYVSGDSGI